MLKVGKNSFQEVLKAVLFGVGVYLQQLTFWLFCGSPIRVSTTFILREKLILFALARISNNVLVWSFYFGGKWENPRVVPRERVRSPKFESRRVKLLRDGCACVARVKRGMRNVHRVHVTDIWSWYRVELRVGDHLGRSEELVSRCVECDLAEPESLASLGGSAPGVVDGILSAERISDSRRGITRSQPMHNINRPTSRLQAAFPFSVW